MKKYGNGRCRFQVVSFTLKLTKFHLENVNLRWETMFSSPLIISSNKEKHVYRVYITFYEIGYILLEVHIPQRTRTPFISAATPLPFLFCFVNKPSIHRERSFFSLKLLYVCKSNFNLVLGLVIVKSLCMMSARPWVLPAAIEIKLSPELIGVCSVWDTWEHGRMRRSIQMRRFDFGLKLLD